MLSPHPPGTVKRGFNWLLLIRPEKGRTLTAHTLHRIA